ncbi:MAG: Gfo/Idh/MocA family oxidoreductase [Saprospiraceae bacterium]|nr:Gfo/Idh/MocA family oxidoreductase [Saprospiraceae bacterium]
MKRRTFVQKSGLITAGTSVLPGAWGQSFSNAAAIKKRIALVGTGIRGVTFWGKNLQDNYSDVISFVGLCDINPGRLAFAQKYMGVDCPEYADCDQMLAEAKPDILIVTTVDSTHHQFIIKGLRAGIDVITEKPLTTEDWKCAEILKAERESGRQVIVGFNYRWSPHATRIKELLHKKRVGDITSVDFHWYLNVYHGASYFRRWHGIMERGGSLWVHKATHHFDLLNWWLDSDPVEVSAYGSLEHYGSNHDFRGANCRNCGYTDQCKFYWDITSNDMSMKLYVENEKYDGYIRDNCLWRSEIDIFDKMSAQIKYANGVLVNYSLTTYSPYEGWRIGFNGMNGRIDSWQDIPWRKEERMAQAQLHAAEMKQSDAEAFEDFEEIVVMDNFIEDHELIKVNKPRGGHGGGDRRLQDQIFRDQDMKDPLGHSAGSRDGAMSILVGIAARKSIEEKKPIKIRDLTELVPQAKRPVYF